jgi:PRTRC genetic system protein C
MTQKTYIFENDSISVDSDLTPEQVREVWAEIYPGIATATIHDNGDDTYTFRRTGGTKG